MARLGIEGIEKQDADIPELYVRSGIDTNEIYLVKKKKELNVSYGKKRTSYYN